MTTIYTASQAARLLGVSVATVRRIADEMAEILPDYRPISGKARKLSEGDVKTISALWARLQADTTLTRSVLLAELSATGYEPLVIPDSLPTPEPDISQNAPERPKTNRAISDNLPLSETFLTPFLQAQDDTRRQLAELSARIAEISQERPAQGKEYKQLWTFAIAIALSIALLLGVVTVSALLPNNQTTLWTSALALQVLIAAVVLPSVRR